MLACLLCVDVGVPPTPRGMICARHGCTASGRAIRLARLPPPPPPRPRALAWPAVQASSDAPGGCCRDLSSSAYVDECCRTDAPSVRRLRHGRGALPVDRALDGDLIATCRRRHCLRRFNVNDNTSALCGYHPVVPSVSYDGDYYPCCKWRGAGVGAVARAALLRGWVSELATPPLVAAGGCHMGAR
jgi:hypothetical protein